MTEKEDRYFWWYLLLTLAMGAVIFWLFGAFQAHASDVPVFGGSASEDASMAPIVGLIVSVLLLASVTVWPLRDWK